MEKFLVKEHIGEFFTKMYEANKGKKLEVSLKVDEKKIIIYYKETGTFDYVSLIDEQKNIDRLVEILSSKQSWKQRTT